LYELLQRYLSSDTTSTLVPFLGFYLLSLILTIEMGEDCSCGKELMELTRPLSSTSFGLTLTIETIFLPCILSNNIHYLHAPLDHASQPAWRGENTCILNSDLRSDVSV
jgi:hypothetical protein